MFQRLILTISIPHFFNDQKNVHLRKAWKAKKKTENLLVDKLSIYSFRLYLNTSDIRRLIEVDNPRASSFEASFNIKTLD